MFRTTNVQNKWKIGPSEGILFHFPPKTPLSAENVPALISAAERSAAPSPACVRSVVPRVAPFGSHIVPFSSHIVPPGSFVVPLGSRMIPPRPHAGTTATPLSRCPHHPLLFSRRSGNHSFRSAEPPRRLEQKNSAFFWSFRKIFTTFATYCSDNLVSAPQRFARRIRLSSHPGIPMTGDVPAAGSEQHTETIYL